MKHILVLSLLLIFSGCLIIHKVPTAAIYQIQEKIETINKKGRYIYYLIPISGPTESSYIGSVEYVFIECDSFCVNDKIGTFNNIDFFKAK